jgi:hypothetical protein
MLCLYVGEIFFGYWNERDEFFAYYDFYSCDFLLQDDRLPFKYYFDTRIPIRGSYRIRDSIVKFCEDGEIRSSSQINIKHSSSIPSTIKYDGNFVENFSKSVGEAFRTTGAKFDTSAIGYFSNNECLMLKYSGKLFSTWHFLGKAPIMDNIVFAKRWPMILPIPTQQKEAQIQYVTGGYPISCTIGNDPGAVFTQRFTKKKVVGLNFAGLSSIEYGGAIYSAIGCADYGPELKEEPEIFVPLDWESKCQTGIEEREFPDSESYVVKIGEDFYSNKGLKTEYRSRPRINRADFCDLLGIYEDVGGVIWNMIFG